MGKKAEAVAKAKLYVSQAKANPTLVGKVKVKLRDLSDQLTRYKEELLLIEQDWDEISFEYGIN